MPVKTNVRTVICKYFRAMVNCFPQEYGTEITFNTCVSLRLISLEDKNWTQTFFSQTFRAPPGYPGKIPGHPAKKFGFPGFQRTYRTFWPPPQQMSITHTHTCMDQVCTNYPLTLYLKSASWHACLIPPDSKSLRKQFSEDYFSWFSKQGSTPTPWARGLRDQHQI